MSSTPHQHNHSQHTFIISVCIGALSQCRQRPQNGNDNATAAEQICGTQQCEPSRPMWICFRSIIDDNIRNICGDLRCNDSDDEDEFAVSKMAFDDDESRADEGEDGEEEQSAHTAGDEWALGLLCRRRVCWRWRCAGSGDMFAGGRYVFAGGGYVFAELELCLLDISSLEWVRDVDMRTNFSGIN